MFPGGILLRGMRPLYQNINGSIMTLATQSSIQDSYWLSSQKTMIIYLRYSTLNWPRNNLLFKLRDVENGMDFGRRR